MKTRLPRHEILHQLRGHQEKRHRDLVCHRSVDCRWIFQPSVSDMASLAAEMTLEDADDCCNKATGIYVHSAKRTGYLCLLLQTLHNYLYGRWFRPYKSEIEYVQFIAKTLEEYSDKDLDIAQLPVLLVRTGTEDGLSAPISFESIAHHIHSAIHDTAKGEIAVRVALEVAVDFIMMLEKRETDAFGHQPDPIASTRDLEDGGLAGRYEILQTAETLGWGDEPLAGPSSGWVDTKIHTGWCGGGVDSDNWKRRAQRLERENVIRAEEMYPEPYQWPAILQGSRKHWQIWRD
ncbi:hypothetical protein M419DRAFT_89470 [Trichoderma reesei RUT C-30]|uniref:Uncharacterized protein n=1 Tax=Hypocrea jecorina (strain ATCC 56765 / BCRC 32924 / NRRL 11460 / Rut C-30) TaxID=1344414 RepID=A0A024RYS4_HYPJR|nr:hypothetical protein M419DRAFT_89470 [Trichoderma reesei RUT C-30]